MDSVGFVGWMFLIGHVTSASLLSDRMLLFTSEERTGSVFQMNLLGNETRQLQLSKSYESNPVALTFDWKRSLLYWSDGRNIRRAGLDGANAETLLHRPRGSNVEGLALDPEANLLFFTDSGFDRIYIAHPGSQELKTVQTSPRQPKTIRLDPANRRFYWSDWASQTIRSCDYRGDSCRTNVNASEQWINGIGLDLTESKLYWTDGMADHIWSSDLDGGSPRIVRTFNHSVSVNGSVQTVVGGIHLFGISASRGRLYFTNWYNRSILTCNSDGSELQVLGPNTYEILKDLVLVDSDAFPQSTASNCSSSNGGCSHFCIPALVPRGHVCECPDTRRMTPDARTCTREATANGPDLMWIEYDGFYSAYVRGVTGDPRHYLDTKKVRTWSVRSTAFHWSAMDVDYPNSALYLLDRFDKLVVKMSLNGTKEIKGVYYGTSSEARAIAVDWQNGNIYWTDGLYNLIMMARAEEDTNTTRVVVRVGLDQPHGLALHPARGLMFWSQNGEISNIERANMDGRDRRVIVSGAMEQPYGVTVDYDSDRVFWASDSGIESVSIDGSNRKSYPRMSGFRFADVTVYKSFVFATERGSGKRTSQVWFYDLTKNESAVKLPLARQPYSIAMYAAQRQRPGTNECAKLNCEQLCAPTPAGPICLCTDEYELASDERRCLPSTTSFSLSYVYSLGDRLCQVLARDATSSFRRDPTKCFFEKPAHFEFHALDFNARTGDVYFSDIKFKVKSIRRANWRDKADNSIIVHGTGVVDGIALDWVSGNLFWTDVTHRQIWVSRQDGSYQKLLLQRPDSPMAIVADPVRKDLYWIESGVIMTSYMDGERARKFVGRGLERPTGLTIDFRRERLLWADAQNNLTQIGWKTLSGLEKGDFMLPVGRRYKPQDIAILQDFVAFTERTDDVESGIRVIEISTGSEVNRGYFRHDAKAYEIIALDVHNQPEVDDTSCMELACEQLCLSGHASRASCACVDGQMLSEDERTCRPNSILEDRFFLLADDYRHQVYQTDERFSTLNALKFPASDRPIGVDFDFETTSLFWTDFKKGIIKRSDLNGTNVKIIKSEAADSRVDGIAVESVSGIVYFADLTRHQIGITDIDGKNQKLLIRDKLEQPRAIVLDPSAGTMYIASKGRIERADLSGQNRTTLLENGRGWVSGLALDDHGTLYWCNHHTETIGMIRLDGSYNGTLYKLNRTADPFAIAVLGEMVYWTDWNARGVQRYARKQDRLTTLHADIFSGLNDLKFVSRQRRIVDTPCSKGNGGCSHFCLAVSATKRVCACPDDVNGNTVLPPDGRDCQHKRRCGKTIANGGIDFCSRHVGNRCEYHCAPGFGTVTDGAKPSVLCLHNETWQHHESLCVNVTCPHLPIGENTQVVNWCPTSPGNGSRCVTRCKFNFVHVSGDEERLCENGQWSGQTLICEETRHYFMSRSDRSIAKKIASGVAVPVLLITIVALMVFLYRTHRIPRRRNKFGRMESTSSGSDATPAYDASTSQVKLDGSVAFDNPGYGSSSTTTLTAKEPLPDVTETTVYSDDCDGFVNPMCDGHKLDLNENSSNI